MKIQIIRQSSSYKYIKDKSKPESWDNNTNHNCQDTIQLLDDNNKVIYQNNNIQTVANYPNCHTLDTVKPCNFQIKCFVKAGVSFADPNNKDRIKIHGIINAIDEEGQKIDFNSMQIDKNQTKGRWLIHSTYYPRINKDTEFAYSQGCFIFKTTYDLLQFNEILLKNGMNTGTILNGTLSEI